jgi:class 3 adenylate cyclase/tetratricopeptide (TPR) repeat protein
MKEQTSSFDQTLALEIPDHELIRRIGKGSYGEVWLIRNVLGSYRAVKIVERKAFREPRPYEREFEGIKQFEPLSRTHPGFVNILHIGRNERLGHFYCIMELADDASKGRVIDPDGYEPRTLASDLSRKKRLPLIEVVQLGLSLAEALKHLHRHQLIHRDLKPSNIIFVNGAPKLADIGLVTTIGESATSLGTRGYAPPENSVGAAADLYCLGKVLYELSTGNPPERFPDLPMDLQELGEGNRFVRFNEVLLRACDANPPKRYGSAESFRKALNCCLHATEPPRPTSYERQAGTAAESQRSERKLLTVLLAAFATASQGDPEQVQSFMRACLEIVQSVVQRYEGMLAQVSGDSVMATFGGAVALEDHARRAAHAALAIKEAIESRRGQLRSTYGFDFELRLALNTGLAIATKGGVDAPPSGDTVNLAWRIVHLADPNQLIITEETRKTIQDFFLARPLERRTAQGVEVAQRLYELVSAREMRSRIEAVAERGLTPFVGREKELALLRQRLAEARGGRGQIVLLAGEPGVGKSRLLLEFRQSLGVNEVYWLAGRTLSFGSQMAYLPIIDLLRRLFEIRESDTPADIGARIEAETEGHTEHVRRGVPLLKYLLSVPTNGEGVAEMDAQQRRVKTFDVLRNLILTKAQRGPVVLEVEDLHWIDRTSEDFLASFADSLSMAPVVMLLSYRPGYRNPFPERSFITRLMLQPLSVSESVELATRCLSRTVLPEEVRQLVLAKAEGNPFFVEELIKSLNEIGALRQQNGNSGPSGTLSLSQVPDTIQDLILSRIDRLEESPKRTLQLASVIGREFAVSLLETIADIEEPLADSLQKLKGLELIYERSVFPEHTCFFKHALTQEVAYNSLLMQHRKQLHCLVAAAIEELNAARLPEFYGLLAHHYERGEEWERALDYLCRAAERCRSVGGHREEAFHLTQAIAIARRLGQNEIVTSLRGQRGTAWVKAGLWSEARPELEAVLAELPPGNLADRAELLASLAGACFWGLDVPGMQKCAEEGHALATEVGREDLVAESLTWLGASQQALGNLTDAAEFFERARARGGGCFSAALANYPLTLYLRGRLQPALERAREAVEKFRNLSDFFAATFGHPHFGLVLAGCGRYAEAARVFAEARELGEKYEIWAFHARAVAMSAGFHLDVFDWEGHEALAQQAREHARSAPFRPSEVSADIDLVFNYARRGEVGPAESLMKEAEVLAAQIGGWHQWLWSLRLKQARAEIAFARTDWSDALVLASNAIAESDARGRAKYVVAGLETRGRTLVALGRSTEALDDFRRAVRMARAMGDPALFLRASSSLLATEGDDALLSEARTTARRIVAELPNEEMRRRFEAAESVRLLGQL